MKITILYEISIFKTKIRIKTMFRIKKTLVLKKRLFNTNFQKLFFDVFIPYPTQGPYVGSLNLPNPNPNLPKPKIFLG